jgi:hypothetical protein
MIQGLLDGLIRCDSGGHHLDIDMLYPKKASIFDTDAGLAVLDVKGYQAFGSLSRPPSYTRAGLRDMGSISRIVGIDLTILVLKRSQKWTSNNVPGYRESSISI